MAGTVPGDRRSARTFEDLWIWQQSRGLVKNVYCDFGNGTPAERDFNFRSQVQKAAVSIMNNIAEGFERSTDSDFSRFLDIAKASTGEVRSMYYVAQDMNYVTAEVADGRRSLCRQIASAISALAGHLRPGENASRLSRSAGSSRNRNDQ